METVEQLAEELLEAIHTEATTTVSEATVDPSELSVVKAKYDILRAAFVSLAGEDYLQSNGL